MAFVRIDVVAPWRPDALTRSVTSSAWLKQLPSSISMASPGRSVVDAHPPTRPTHHRPGWPTPPSPPPLSLQRQRVLSQRGAQHSVKIQSGPGRRRTAPGAPPGRRVIATGVVRRPATTRPGPVPPAKPRIHRPPRCGHGAEGARLDSPCRSDGGPSSPPLAETRGSQCTHAERIARDRNWVLDLQRTVDEPMPAGSPDSARRDLLPDVRSVCRTGRTNRG